MKKKIVIVILLVLAIISVVSLFILFRKNQKIELLKSSFQFEYGDVIEVKGEDILKTESALILKSFEVDYSELKFENDEKYPQVGSYDLQIKYKLYGDEKEEYVKVIAEDTKKPEFTTLPDNIEIERGYDPNDLVSYFEANDLSPFEITVNSDNLDTDQYGEYEIEVIATDKYGNENLEKVKVIVIEEDEEEIPAKSNDEDINYEKPNENNEENPVEYGETVSTPYTISSPRYVSGIMIVNKKNPVPYNYMPYENAEAGNQVRSLIKEMQDLGYNISSSYSGYRSFDTQAGLYQNYVNRYGQSEADTFSARPGYSEHQTGLAFDLLHGDGSLVENSSEVNWIAQNAHRYGFIVRYQAGKEYITGYQAEPWNIRYVGALASDIYNSGLTLEEYLGVQGGNY